LKPESIKSKSINKETIIKKTKRNSSNLGGLLREKNTGGGLGRRDDFLDEDAVEGWNQTLSH